MGVVERHLYHYSATRRLTKVKGVKHQRVVAPAADDPAADPAKRQKCSAGSNSYLYSPHFFRLEKDHLGLCTVCVDLYPLV